jgi:hypothetical protein
MGSSGKREGRQENERRTAGRAKLLKQIRQRFHERAGQAARRSRRERS